MATRRSLLLGLSAAGLSLAACAGPRGPGGRGGQGRPGSAARDPNSFSRGVELKQLGDIEGAIPHFAQVAGMGKGYELAQFHLGDCFMKQAEAEADPFWASNRTREGVFWITLAAQSGESNAQAHLAQLNFSGNGVDVDRAEAGKYLLLAEANPMAGFLNNSSREGLAQIQQSLSSEEWEEARVRAQVFEKLEQSTRSFPTMPRERRSRPSGASGGDGGGRGGRGGGRRGGVDEDQSVGR